MFDAIVDGVEEPPQQHLAGKPAPDTYLAAARAVGVRAAAVVYEDALAGVAAGRAGQFGYVVGVDRVGQAARCARPAPMWWSVTWPACGGPMIQHPSFPVDPWCLRETELHDGMLARPSGCSPWPTGISAGAGTWTRGSRTACPGRT